MQQDPFLALEMFYPMKVYTYLNYRVNLGVDAIQYDRLTFERAARRGSGSAGNQVGKQEVLTWSQRFWGFVDNYIWMLECNQLNIFNLASFSIVNSILLINLAETICFAVRPKNRDPQTGQYVDPFLNFFESIYWIDSVAKTNSTGSLHRLVVVILIPLLARRLQSLISKYKNAKLNRHEYVKLDVIQMNSAQLDRLAVESVKDFVHFVLACFRHKCNHKHLLRSPEGKQIKTQAMLRMRESKLDWLYYHNLISFDSCFKEASKYMANPYRHEVIEYDWIHPDAQQRSLRKRLWALCKISKTPRRLFIAKPYHRFDPHGLLLQISLYLGVLFILIVTIPINTCAFYYPVLVANGLDADNIFGTLGGAFAAALMNPINLIELIQLTLYVFSIVVHLSDTATLVHNAIVEYSRAKSVIDMFEVELDFYRAHVRAFASYMDKNGLTLSGITTTKPSPTFTKMQDFDPSHVINIRDSSLFMPDPLSYGGDGSGRAGRAGGRGAGLHGRGLEHLLRTFRRAEVDEAKLDEFNDNIKYLMILIRVLQSEQSDLKNHFTWILNMSVFAGTIGLSLASSLFYGCRTAQEVLVVYVPTITLILPIVFSLFMAATSEGFFLKITKTIIPLMVDELRLVEPAVGRDLQKIYSHLSVIENRSFMILGSVPLTFGSLTSIIGWILTFNLLFQHYVP